MSDIAKRPARFEQTSCLREDAALFGREIDHTVRDHHVGRPVRHRHLLDVALLERHGVEPGRPAQALGLLELRVGHVDADDPARAADLQRSDEAVHAGAAAEVDDGLALTHLAEVEVIADAGKGFDRLGRDAAEIRRVAAKPLSERAAHLEVNSPCGFSATRRYMLWTFASRSFGSKVTASVMSRPLSSSA